MKYRYCILGSGRQGVALAHDLARVGEAAEIMLADSDVSVAQKAVARLRKLLPETRCEFTAVACDVSDARRVAEIVKGAQVVLSAVPYRFNEALTDIAIAQRASFNDLGGNTGVVRAQLSRHQKALDAGVSIVPDCGLAPGLGNIVAAYGISQFDTPEHVHVRCGGLPQTPVGPLKYKLVFNFQGLINEYSGLGEFIREGRRVDVPTLSEVEPIEFPAPVGVCEAAVTSGGTSTCSESFLGRVKTYDYKTVRYPGHWSVIRAMFELGCFEEAVRLSNGETIEPKRVLRSLMEERLNYPGVPDLVVLRITVKGRHEGKPRTLQWDLLDFQDTQTGFTAMERTTAFPAALVAHLQARGRVAPGARPLELALPLEQYMQELSAHDIHIKHHVA